MTGVSTKTDAAALEWAINDGVMRLREWGTDTIPILPQSCLLYTSDAADE